MFSVAVIDDALCEQRLWDMKYKGVQNFYMCEIRKDFTIDATFKGNSSRFLNHSCDPNCVLEKWLVSKPLLYLLLICIMLLLFKDSIDIEFPTAPNYC
jgi:hypothetical protein